MAVRHPEDVDTGSIDLVLISSDRWEDELAARAEELWGERVETVRLYEDLPPGPYDKTDDRAEAIRRVRTRASARRDDDLVVIVTDQPRSREAKLALALRSAGARPVLLHHRPSTFDPAAQFERTHRFRNEWEALRIACDYAPTAYHVMVNTDYRLATRFLRHRPGPIVVDSYDLVAGMYTEPFRLEHPAYEAEVPHERFCVERADGLCCRSREIDVLRDEFGYACAPCVMVDDGCWNEPLEPSASATGCELHLAYAGKVVPEKSTCSRFAVEANVWHWQECWQVRASTFTCIPRLKTRPARSRRPSASIAISSGNLHGSTCTGPYRRTRSFGSCRATTGPSSCTTSGRSDPTPPCPGPKPSSAWRRPTSSSTYIDAGLPILHNAAPGSWVANTVERFRVGVNLRNLAPQTWGPLIRGLDWNGLRANARGAREACDVRRHGRRLMDFYHGLPGRLERDTVGGVSSAAQKEPTIHDHTTQRSDGRPAVV